MKLRLLRTYFSKGVIGALYHQKRLEAYCLEMSHPNSHTFLHNMPDGTYYLGKPAGEREGFSLHITLPFTRQRLELCLHDVVTRPLTDCREPVCFTVGDGKLYMADPARDKLMSLFGEAIVRKEKIILTIKTVYDNGRPVNDQ